MVSPLVTWSFNTPDHELQSLVQDTKGSTPLTLCSPISELYCGVHDRRRLWRRHVHTSSRWAPPGPFGTHPRAICGIVRVNDVHDISMIQTVCALTSQLE